MTEADALTRKWGNSLGVIIPRSIVKEEHLEENEKIRIEIRKSHTAKELWGIMKGLKIDAQKAKDEMRASWE